QAPQFAIVTSIAEESASQSVITINTTRFLATKVTPRTIRFSSRHNNARAQIAERNKKTYPHRIGSRVVSNPTEKALVLYPKTWRPNPPPVNHSSQPKAVSPRAAPDTAAMRAARRFSAKDTASAAIGPAIAVGLVYNARRNSSTATMSHLG